MGTDEALLVQALKGDRAALEGFRGRRQGEAFRFALLLAGSSALAEDVLQECWLEILKGKGGFDPARGSARGWFLGMVRRKVFRLARLERRPAAPADLISRLRLAEPASPDEGLLLREDLERLWAALESLSPECREAVLCRWALGWDDRTMAEGLGIAVEAARQRAHRGLEALRRSLTGGKR